MIKNISNKNILVTPFTAIKKWALYNTVNDDLILLSTNDTVSYDYMDYFLTPPTLNSVCSIAINYNAIENPVCQEGISGSGIFYPDTEAQNKDGTYKRLVYDEIAKMFYNTYRNPTQIFGMDNIDFPLSNTNRILGNQFLLFNISMDTMGDRLVPGSIEMYDLNYDENVKITDDCNGNLIVNNRLFAKVQELRHISNDVQNGNVSNGC